MADKHHGPANKNRDVSRDDTTPYRTNEDYPDFNTPLNVTKDGPEPGADVWGFDEWESGTGVPDPNDYVAHLIGGKGKKK